MNHGERVPNENATIVLGLYPRAPSPIKGEELSNDILRRHVDKKIARGD